MKIMVTGSGTNIGNHIAEKLLKNNYNVTCTYHKKYPKNLKKYKNSNILKINLDKKIKKNFNIDTLIHCASATPEKYQNKYFNKINVWGFNNLLKKMQSKKLNKVILISSIAIYENNKQKLINEKTNPKFDSEYALSKIKQEKTLKNFKKQGLKKIILRLPSILSKNSKVNFYCNAVINIKKGRKIFLFGKKKKINSIFYIDDLTKLILLLIKSKNKTLRQTYNVASTEPMKILDVLKKIYKKLKKPRKIILINKEQREYIISTKKLAQTKF